MSRRVRLPAADELFRATTEDDEATPDTRPENTERPVRAAATPESPPARRSSGRVRHDEKMTVYVTAEELLEIEHARLIVRRLLGGSVDRGRIVRAAVAMALADLDARGEDSDLVRRLRGA